MKMGFERGFPKGLEYVFVGHDDKVLGYINGKRTTTAAE